MDGFLNWFFEFMTTMIKGVWQALSNIFFGIVTIFDFPTYFDQFNRYKGDFGVLGWILAVLAFIIVPFLLVVGFCRLVRFFVSDSSDGLRPRGKDRTTPHAGDGETAASSDDTIDCEVISSRTLNENGQEIR